MALKRGEPANLTVQLPGAAGAVSGARGGTPLATAPALVIGTLDSYDIALTAAETNDAVFYLLLTDGAGSEYGITVVTDEPADLGPALDAIDDVAADVAVIREATTFAPDEVLLTQDTLDTGDVAIGITTPGATVTAYLRTDVNRAVAKRSTTAETDGDWQLQVARAAEYTLVFTHDRYRELTREVDVP